MLAQVVAEYGGLASDKTPNDWLSDLVERITKATPGEYVVIGIGALVVIYVVKKLFDAVHSTGLRS